MGERTVPDPSAGPSGPVTSTAAWTDDSARRWAAVADQVEAQLTPVNAVLFEAASLRPGEVVLDVGCGRGATTRHAHDAVTPGGRAVGLDVSDTLLADAARLAEGRAIEWVEGDAQRMALPPAGHDVIISRFGVMFFDHPPTAFANLAAATRTGGRLALAVWQPRDRSPILQHALDVAVATAARHGTTLDMPSPDAGAGSLGDPDLVVRLLSGAGWEHVTCTPHRVPMHLCGPGSPAEAADASLGFGTVRATLADLDPEVAAAVRQALVADLTTRHDGTGVPLDGNILLVTARRS